MWSMEAPESWFTSVQEERTALLMVPTSPQGMSMVVTVHSPLMVLE